MAKKYEPLSCEVCGINIATAKDYREEHEESIQYYVCGNCLSINDEWYFRILRAKDGIGKKRVLGRLTEKGWKAYLIKKEGNQ